MNAVLDELRAAVAGIASRSPCVAYVIVFGSVARNRAHERSDVDLAIGGDLELPERLSLERDLERAIGRTVQVTPVAGASPALRARIFRDGVVDWERNRERRVRDHERAIIDYLDYEPVESLYLARVRARVLGGPADGR